VFTLWEGGTGPTKGDKTIPKFQGGSDWGKAATEYVKTASKLPNKDWVSILTRLGLDTTMPATLPVAR
jgi:hypothetical protein